MRVQVINEVTTNPDAKDEWKLCFQWCLYVYDDGSSQNGYRFIWRYPPDNKLQPARGQARLPSLKHIEILTKMAKSKGWGDYDTEEVGYKK